MVCSWGIPHALAAQPCYLNTKPSCFHQGLNPENCSLYTFGAAHLGERAGRGRAEMGVTRSSLGGAERWGGAGQGMARGLRCDFEAMDHLEELGTMTLELLIKVKGLLGTQPCLD